MNIHKEKERVDFTDSQLLGRLLAFAKPYWKMIGLCLVLAILIVVADLARPYLLKLAIDEHIHGLNRPMLSDTADKTEELARFGDVTEVDGRVYVRVPEDADLTNLPSTAAKRQIVEVNDREYMAEGWLPAGKKEAPEVRKDAGGKTELVMSGQTYPAVPLEAEQVKAFRQHDYRGFVNLGVLFLITVVVSSVLNYVQGNLLQYTGQTIIFNIREKLFTHLSRMSMSFFDRNPVGRLVVRVTQDTESLNQLYSQVVVNLIKDVIVVIGIVIIMLQMSLKLSLLAFAVLPVLALMTFYYRKVVREAQRRARLILSRLNSFLAENLSGIRITQLFIREERQWEQFDSHNTAYYKAGMKGTVINSIFQPAIGFMGNLAIALLIWYGGLNVIEGGITFGVVYAFTQYIRQFFQPLMSLAEKYNQIQTSMVGAERIFDMLDEKPGMAEPEQPVPLPKQVRGEIEFENVWFAYTNEDWVLKDVSFKIEPGQTIAFVGATGAGKSSIIQLINRFYDIQKGSIKLDGVDIRRIPLDELRRCISVVQQDVFLFTGDIASNIRLNDPSITDAQIEQAARMVHMDDFIRRQPLGYHTPLGERGVSLSLGQRQLLSFARAIAFKPQILILDEATSNIDTETELIVQDALHRISKGRTTMIVAHRLSTIQHADQIIVMHKGRVREIGSHYQLLAQKGYYYRLFELQYKDQRGLKTAE
ncbi:ABC transporter ATP-binding protein [Paenibacillus aurantius]|uniref:ABC transporter ATP-binding protein n=1 Tax=Paenibacillus aurantius TaxID=2918900 RepID=A0AA96LFZ2_9BACL|nr:ABC transporter ATP-binding protein [Paenibacillus aurantius]WNQ12600.1 ABC transporter ATP-binding protein [Paenibacillus aurantius]